MLELSSKTTLQRAKAAYLASHTLPEAQVKNRAGLIISLLQSDAPLPSDLMDLAALDKASFDWLAGHTKALQDSAVYDTWPDDMPETISDDQAETFYLHFVAGKVRSNGYG